MMGVGSWKAVYNGTLFAVEKIPAYSKAQSKLMTSLVNVSLKFQN